MVDKFTLQCSRCICFSCHLYSTVPWRQHALGPEYLTPEYCVPDGLFFAHRIYACTSAWEANTAHLSVPVLTLLSYQALPTPAIVWLSLS